MFAVVVFDVHYDDDSYLVTVSKINNNNIANSRPTYL